MPECPPSRRATAELAKSEIERQFPLLHAQALVGIWGALEAAVEDCLVAAIQSDPEVRRLPQVSRIKLSFGDFRDLSADELARRVVAELQRTFGADQRLGVGPFECLLECVGAKGCADEETRRTLLEFQQYRHVLVHRAGLVDRAFVERCGWLPLKAGERVMIGHADFARLVTAALHYAKAVRTRVAVRDLALETLA